MSNTKQTAVEWLIEQQWKIQVKYCNNELNCVQYSDLHDELKQQARAMERGQIVEFADDYADQVMAGMIKRASEYCDEIHGKLE